MKKQEARRILFSQAVMLAFACTSALAKEITDFGTLYKSKSYDEICKKFEADKATNWRNPNSTYFYALGLLGQGKTATALGVFKSIQKQHPKTDAAKLAGSAITLWSKKSGAEKSQPPKSGAAKSSASTSKNQVDQHIGIVGLKFVLGQGVPPTINRVFPGTPAYEAGLKDRDIIRAVDGVPTEGLTKEEIFSMIVGPPDSVVRMTIHRNGVAIEMQMKRMLLDRLKEIDPEVYRDYIMSL